MCNTITMQMWDVVARILSIVGFNRHNLQVETCAHRDTENHTSWGRLLNIVGFLSVPRLTIVSSTVRSL